MQDPHEPTCGQHVQDKWRGASKTTSLRPSSRFPAVSAPMCRAPRHPHVSRDVNVKGTKAQCWERGASVDGHPAIGRGPAVFLRGAEASEDPEDPAGSEDCYGPPPGTGSHPQTSAWGGGGRGAFP